ncbi:hypothetical protein ABB37_09593 [Leptomonas pyrrhocoris]|uniref:Uncharacterized protein n=1 Tax=Leptomonas pyrrhocoris TaxID=157538 RepID=A0A0N0VCV6_LEPPY|nr:hypothetical protein ABB37_09593 [Leptomonas pyrrhocoris]KPA73651.1 hypothetical protein ABB37_09593 [Leptomonas pyrrhocoris]|eukprot:XP_015652090.1 hypothetical protein ABB37_09593 [Leptomonas pyrrhocoris]
MYFDHSPSQRQQQSRYAPRSTSPASTATTTLLPFRRSERGVNLAVALSPVQGYLQPQWAVPSAAAATQRPPSPPMRDSFQAQQQRGAWTSAAAPHAYCVRGHPDAPSAQLYGRSPYREEDGDEEAAAAASSAAPPAAFAAVPTVVVSDAARCPSLSSSPSPPLTSRRPFATSPSAADGAAAVGGCTAARRAGIAPNRFDRVVGAAEPPSSSAARPRGRGIAEVRPGCTTSTERVRYRSNVTKKLIDLYDEVAELYECRGNMTFQVTQAMRSDPRYTKERHGEVRLAYKPAPAQQAAVTAVESSLEALHDACHELVAAYLTPEEKRYLGIDTHLFQTNAEKKSTYQYAPANPTSKAPPDSPSQQEEGSTNTARPPSVSSGSQHEQRPSHPDGVKFTTQATAVPSTSAAAPSSRQTPTPTPQYSLASAAFQEDQAVSANNTNYNENTQLNTSADQPYSLIEASAIVSPSTAAASTTHNDPAQMNRAALPPSLPPPAAVSSVYPPPQQQQQQQQQPAAVGVPAASQREAATDDTVAVGSVSSPERMYAPAGSTSSLGGGAWPSDTATATARASPVAPRPSVPAKVLVQPPPPSAVGAGRNGASARASCAPPKMPPGIPPGAKLVKMPMGVPPPAAAAAAATTTTTATTDAALASSTVAAAGGGGLSASHPPMHPPSRNSSFTNRTAAAAPKAPAMRAEFKRFLIDSDSDSMA